MAAGTASCALLFLGWLEPISGAARRFRGAARFLLCTGWRDSSAAVSSALRFSSARRRSSSLGILKGTLFAAPRFLER